VPDCGDISDERTSTTREGTHFSKRVLIPNERIRGYLQQYSVGVHASNIVNELRGEIGEHMPSLLPLIERLLEESVADQHQFECPVKWRRLIKDLTSHSPVAGGMIKNPAYVLCWMSEFLERESKTFTYEDLVESIIPNFPLLRDWIGDMEWNDLPTYAVCLWECIMEKLSDLLSHCDIEYRFRERNMEDEKRRGLFHGGTNRITRIMNRYRLQTRGIGNDISCTKLWGNRKSLIPGLMICCCPHGIVLGFSTMTQPESEGTVFDMLYTNVPILKNKVIIYDAACRLWNYSCNREPSLFRSTSM
jgi:hypothetical protein